MYTRHATHPALQELAAFALGKLPQAEATLVARHLETCPACAQAVKQTPADSFLGLLNQARPGAGTGSAASHTGRAP